MTDHAAFLEAIRAEFPELRAELDEEGTAGLPHLQTALLAAHVQRAIGSGDLETVGRAFRLVGRCWADSDPALANAIAVSFLENLDFRRKRGHGAEARALLPPNLRAAHDSVELQWSRMFPGRPLPEPRLRKTAR